MNPISNQPHSKFDASKSQWGILLIAILLGGLGAYMLQLYMKQSIFKVSGGDLRPMLFTTQTIPSGTTILPSMLDKRDVPGAYASLSAIPESEKSFVVGQKTIANVEKGQALLWSHFDLADRADLSQKLLINERAVTMNVDQRSGMDGLLQVGDRVDVLCTLEIPGRDLGEQRSTTRSLAQNITVLAINGKMMSEAVSQSHDGTQSAADLAKSGLKMDQVHTGANTVTLKVSTEEAILLAFAESKGEVRFVLRSKEDVFVSDAPEIGFSDLANGVEFKQPRPQPAHEDYPVIYEEGVKRGSGYLPSVPSDDRPAIQDLLKAQEMLKQILSSEEEKASEDKLKPSSEKPAK
jgi:Flp pilus assembly protein CpaB